MNVEEYDNMYRQEQSYWWFISRTELLHFYLRDILRVAPDARIMDLGCGTGVNLEVLSHYGTALGIDFSTAALAFCRRRSLARLAQGDGQTLPIASNSLDLVTAMDSLEHIPDDRTTLAEILRVLKPGGTLLVAVPAFGFLWSEHDEALQHLRRYTAAELTNKMKLVGLAPGKVTYVMFLLFLPVLFIRFVQNLTKKNTHPKTAITLLPEFVNRMLLVLNRLEMALLRWINYPIGVTIVAVATKPR